MPDGITSSGACPTCGQARWALDQCTCGHGLVEHDTGTRKGRKVYTACSVTTADGQCPCRLAVALKYVSVHPALEPVLDDGSAEAARLITRGMEIADRRSRVET